MLNVIKQVKGRVKKILKSLMIFYVRQKKEIRVVFVLTEVAAWKTEPLYQMMRNHSRFKPLLAVTRSIDIPSAYEKLLEYLNLKQYTYFELDLSKTIITQLHPDILFFQKPYEGSYPFLHSPLKNRFTLLAYVPYGFHNVMEPWTYNLYIHQNCWQHYHENSMCAKASKEHLQKNRESVVITGVPMMDELLISKDCLNDVWLDTKRRKRIIYAPHHTIGDNNASGISYSTFLENADFILSLAKRYESETYWAFKPHPSLKDKLYAVWGAKRTDTYYKKWAEMENSQFENGKYIELFKFSDAMIHDCSTFTQEYLYTKNPVLYLVRDEHHTDNLNEFAKESYNLHYHARNHADIEQFIKNIINGNDILKGKRIEFFKKALLPPNGKTACENIINAILGEEEYN